MSQSSLHQSLQQLFEQRDPARLEQCLRHADFDRFARERGLGVSGELLARAFVHSSFAHEYDVPHQERLEFLGDAVLQLILTQELMRRHPQAKEGELSRLRSSLVNEESLSRLARALELGALLLLGKGEFRKGLAQQDVVLADTFEALVGVHFGARGLAETSTLVLGWYEQFLPGALELTRLEEFDAKSQLQQKSLAAFKKLPAYTAEAQGESFLVKLWLDEKLVASGVYSSKKAGEKALARRALDEGMI
jgi:ribonuclease-3